jgi:hypothetical protein
MRNRRKPFKGRQFTPEVILWAVRWYLQFPISYRDLELMLRDRGVSVDHTTIYRWIQAYAAELEKRLRPHLRRTNGSWRVDETYIKVKNVLRVWASTGFHPSSPGPAPASAPHSPARLPTGSLRTLLTIRRRLTGRGLGGPLDGPALALVVGPGEHQGKAPGEGPLLTRSGRWR